MGLFDDLLKKHPPTGEKYRKDSTAADLPSVNHRETVPPLKWVTAKDIDVTDLVNRLVGKKIRGISSMVIEEGKASYLVLDMDTRDAYTAMSDGEYWTVVQKGPGANSEPIAKWLTRPDESCDNATWIIETRLAKFKPLQLKFFCRKIELKQEITRHMFDSSLGPITLHSRPSRGGTLGCLQIRGQHSCTNYFFNPGPGHIVEIGKSENPPF